MRDSRFRRGVNEDVVSVKTSGGAQLINATEVPVHDKSTEDSTVNIKAAEGEMKTVGEVSETYNDEKSDTSEDITNPKTPGNIMCAHKYRSTLALFLITLLRQ